MSASPTDPDDLPRQMQTGDRAALADCFARCRDRLWRVADFRLDPRLRRRVDADDVLQHTYLEADRRLEHFRGETQTEVFVWLRLVLIQTLTDLYRAHLGTEMRNASREHSLDASFGMDGTSVSLAHHLIAELTSPSRAAMRAETEEDLRRVIAEMDPIDREIIALRHFEELGNSEAAEVLGIQPKAASIRYVRALARLKTILAPSVDDGKKS
jgi:RNA polymerase sigma-70 factor (ECF subfamily)